MGFSATLGGMTREQKLTGLALLAHRVNFDRTSRFRTLDAARIEAGISRGSWEKVEKGIKVRDATLRAVERALGWPRGRATRIIEGEDDAGDVYAILGDFRDWVRTSDTFSEAQRRELLERLDQLGEIQQIAREVVEEANESQPSPESRSAEGA